MKSAECETEKRGKGKAVKDGSVSLTWMEYIMILKQRTAKVFPSHREWLSKCLWGYEQRKRNRLDKQDVITQQ